MKINILIIVLCLFINNMQLYAQCCSAGSPSGSDGVLGGISKNELILNIFHRHSLSKDYFHQSVKTEMPVIDRSFFDFLNFTASYGISDKFAFHTELGYFVDKTQRVFFDSTLHKIQSRGLGDLSIALKYKLYNSFDRQKQLIVTGGLKIPVGAFNEEQNGITIPVSLQPSSGALKMNGSLYFMQKNPAKKIGWNMLIMAELSNRIEKGFIEYKYGNYLQYMAGTNFTHNKNLISYLNIKYELRGRDQRENKTIIESSGGHVVYLNPSIKLSLPKNWSIIILGDIPVYKYVNGYQLTNFFAFQTGIRKDILNCFKNTD